MLKNITHNLQQAKLKNTPARQAILNLLKNNNKPLSVDNINQKLQNKYDLATIYRNMTTLKDKGLIFSDIINRIEYFYIADCAHHHIICRQCQNIVCVPCNHQITVIKGFSQITHQTILTGLCRRCAKI